MVLHVGDVATHVLELPDGPEKDAVLVVMGVLFGTGDVSETFDILRVEKAGSQHGRAAYVPPF